MQEKQRAAWIILHLFSAVSSIHSVSVSLSLSELRKKCTSKVVAPATTKSFEG